jgi:hypothetical protein
MPTIEIEDNLIADINSAAKSANKTPADFVNSTLREILKGFRGNASDEENVRSFIESYKKNPQAAEEYDSWQDEQVWEDK